MKNFSLERRRIRSNNIAIVNIRFFLWKRKGETATIVEMKKLILASQSPRRKELLEMLNLPFEVIPSDSKEVIDLSKPIEEAIAEVAHQKAKRVAEDHADAIVIGSDTVVSIEGKILGKPKDEEDAKCMLRELSGKVHQVITAVAIISSSQEERFSCVTDVEFFDLSDEEIEEYVASGEPMDKAGAYGIQGLSAKYIEKINGDYFNVVGLPVSRLYIAMKEIGYINE